MRLGKTLVALSLALGLATPLLAMPGGNANGSRSCSVDDLAMVRAMVDAACDCAAASTHGSHVSCASRTLNAAVRAGTISRGCRRLARQAAVHSTCGKVGAVTCCRTKENLTTSCSVKRSPEACRAPRGGSACVASATSCADACSDTGCASPSGAFLDRF